LPYEKIYIEAPADEAKVIFYNRFGHNPERISCTCCGDDYSIDESESLEIASAYHRGCRYAYFNAKGKEITPERKYSVPKGTKGRYVDEPDTEGFNDYQPLAEYIQQPDVLVIYAKDIKEGERVGELPEQGWVYVG
jgi:hypothetical protein